MEKENVCSRKAELFLNKIEDMMLDFEKKDMDRYERDREEAKMFLIRTINCVVHPEKFY